MHLHRPEENNNKKNIYAHSKTTTSVYGTIPIIGADKNYLGNAPNEINQNVSEDVRHISVSHGSHGDYRPPKSIGY